MTTPRANQTQTPTAKKLLLDPILRRDIDLLVQSLHHESLLKDIDLLVSSEAPVIKKLQKSGLLPIEKIELEHAIHLIYLCRTSNLTRSSKFSNALLLTTIQHAKEKGWNVLYETYHHSKQKPEDIKVAIRDYLKSIFFPQLFRGIRELGPKNALYRIFSTNWDVDNVDARQWLTDNSILFELGAAILCKEKDIGELAAFSAHCVAPLQQSMFQKYKSFSSCVDMNFESLVHNFIGINPFEEEGLQIMCKIKQIYLDHTPPDFIDNLIQLMQLETISVPIETMADFWENIEVDLLSKEERISRVLFIIIIANWIRESNAGSVKSVLDHQSAKLLFTIQFNKYENFKAILEMDPDRNHTLTVCKNKLMEWKKKTAGFSFFNNKHQKDLDTLNSFLRKLTDLAPASRGRNLR